MLLNIVQLRVEISAFDAIPNVSYSTSSMNSTKSIASSKKMSIILFIYIFYC